MLNKNLKNKNTTGWKRRNVRGRIKIIDKLASEGLTEEVTLE